MSVDFHVQKYRREGVNAILESENHLVCLTSPNASRDNPGVKYYLQKGKVWSGMDDEIKPEDIPEWLQKQMKAMNPKVLEKCGFGPQGAKARTQGMSDRDRLKALLADGLISREEYDRLSITTASEIEASPETQENINTSIETNPENTASN